MGARPHRILGARGGDSINPNAGVAVDINFNNGTYSLVSVDPNCTALAGFVAGDPAGTDLPFTL